MRFKSVNMALLSKQPLLRIVLLYNLVVYLCFLAVYFSIDFSKHFSSAQPISWRGRVYFATLTHAVGGPNGTVPITDTGRMIMALHVTLAWLHLVFVFLH